MPLPTTWPAHATPEEAAAWMNSHFPNTMMGHLQVRVLAISPGHATGEMPVHDGILGIHRAVHMGAFVTLADTIATWASMAAHAKPGVPLRLPLAVSAGAQFLANVGDGTLRAQSTASRIGGTIDAMDTRITHVETGKLLAVVQTTHFVPR